MMATRPVFSLINVSARAACAMAVWLLAYRTMPLSFFFEVVVLVVLTIALCETRADTALVAFNILLRHLNGPSS